MEGEVVLEGDRSIGEANAVFVEVPFLQQCMHKRTARQAVWRLSQLTAWEITGAARRAVSGAATG